MAAKAIYLYGIVAGDAALPLITGLDASHPIYRLQAEGIDDLAAVVGPVNPDVLTLDGSETEKVAALTGYVIQHNNVITELHETTDVLPTPFGAIFNDSAAVKTLLTQRANVWREALQRVRGCVEIGLKAFVDTGALVSSHLPQTNGSSAGMNYMLRRKAEMDAQKLADQVMNTALTEVHQACAAIARESVIKPVQSGSFDERGELMLRAIYLVPREQSEALRRALETVEAGAWLSIEIDGDFAPYHFVEIEKADV